MFVAIYLVFKPNMNMQIWKNKNKSFLKLDKQATKRNEFMNVFI